MANELEDKTFCEFERMVRERELKSLHCLQRLWNEIGLPIDNVTLRKEKVCSYLEDLLGRMVEEQEDEKATLICEIEGMLKNADKLSKELKMDINVNCDDGLPLLQVKTVLENRLERYVRCRAERVDKLRGLIDNASELTAAMGKLDLPRMPEVPSEEELQDFEGLIRGAAAEKMRREQVFRVTRTKILASMEELDIEPELDFQRRVVDGNTFVLSEANMDELKELERSMERRVSETRELVTELREKLSLLWERLNEPAELREAFIAGFAGIGKATIAAIRAETARCEIKKRENIKHFVLAVRLEMVEMWDKCHMSQAERDRFRHFDNNLYLEDLLDLHEQELERLKQFYQENERMFLLVAQREEVWERKLVLEGRTNSPGRLYDNRGGKLLQEEKERKTITHKLPKIEDELRKLAARYEVEKGEPFTIDGQRLDEYIANQWADHEARKESQKLERKVRSNTLGSSTNKRKLVATPSATRSDCKRTRVAENDKLSAQRPPAASAPTREACSRARVARKVFGSKIAVRTNHRGDQQNHEPNVQPEPNMTTYTDFQDHLESGHATRSSVKLSMRDRNMTYRAATPGARTPLCPKTPVASKTLGSKTPVGPKTPLGQRTPLGARSPLGGRTLALSIARSPGKVASSRLFTPARNRLPFLI